MPLIILIGIPVLILALLGIELTVTSFFCTALSLGALRFLLILALAIYKKE